MSGQRLSAAAAERLRPRLSPRDFSIIHSLEMARVLTGQQLTRLHFHTLSADTQDRTRRRVLERLHRWGVVTRLDRSIGGIRAGSTGWVYALGPAGQRLVEQPTATRIRKPWTPSLLFLSHSLAVSEVYVQLVEAGRSGGIDLASFQTEPACWWPDGLGGFLKPDAYLVLRGPGYDELVWLEVDRATESLPTMRRKLQTYLDFVARGQLGPSGVMPQVVISTTTDQRQHQLEAIGRGLEGGETLFVFTTAEGVTEKLFRLAAGTPEQPP